MSDIKSAAIPKLIKGRDDFSFICYVLSLQTFLHLLYTSTIQKKYEESHKCQLPIYFFNVLRPHFKQETETRDIKVSNILLALIYGSYCTFNMQSIEKMNKVFCILFFKIWCMLYAYNLGKFRTTSLVFGGFPQPVSTVWDSKFCMSPFEAQSSVCDEKFLFWRFRKSWTYILNQHNDAIIVQFC